LNPLHIMKRGFALPFKEDKTLIKSVEQLSVGERLKINISDGRFYCQVQDIRRDLDER